MAYNSQIATDFGVDYINKRIYHVVGNSNVYTTRDFYSWLMDTFDELGQMDDPIPASAQTPTDYTLINGWFIDDVSVQFLKGGAIKTAGWTNNISILKFGATYTNAVIGDIGKVVNQAGATGTLLSIDNTNKVWMVRNITGTFAASTATTITSGTGAGTTDTAGNGGYATGESLWSNVYTLGTIDLTSQIYVVQGTTKLTPWWPTGHIDVLIKVKEADTLIASGSITVMDRKYGNSYDHFSLDISGGGRNAVPLATSADLNNTTSSATVATWSDITVNFGTVSKTLNGTTKNYDITINCNNRTFAQVYEYLKYITRDGSVTTLNGTQGQMYLYANATYTTIKAAPFGTFAGGKMFGAQGVWFDNIAGADVKNYQVISSDNTVISPPNVVSATISGLKAGDRVGIYRRTSATTGSPIQKDTYTVTGAIASNASTIVVSTAIASDTPAIGYVRVGDDLYKYDSWAGSTFTLNASGLIKAGGYTAGQNVWVPILDVESETTSASNSLTYLADIPVIVRVRSYANKILPFEVEGMIISTGLAVTAIRTSDSIAL